MRVEIHGKGRQCEGLHYMIVDGHGLALDLDNMRNSIVDPGTLTDPTIVKVTWGPTIDHKEAGTIIRQDGSKQTFADKNLLKPYLARYQARKTELLGAE